MHELSPEQMTIAHGVDHHVSVIAGPGTGKTQTIVARVQQLLDDGCDPQDIVVVTFTRKAARELRTRLGKPGRHCRIGTFHSVIYDSMPNTPSILNQATADGLLDSCAELLGIAKRTPSGLKYSRHSRTKCRQVVDGARMTGVCALPALKSLVDQYSFRLQASGSIDYAGIMAYGIHHTVPAKYMIVDEAQDADPWQWEFIRKVGLHARVMVVGDPSQCIYAWRGVDPEYFPKPGWPQLVLSKSFRHPPGIVHAANALARHIGGGMDHLQATKTDGQIVTMKGIGVLDTVKSLQAALYADQSIAILCRYNHQVARYAQVLANDGHPVFAHRQDSTDHLKSLLTYLNSPHNPILKTDCAHLLSDVAGLMPHPLIQHICTSSIERCEIFCRDWLAGLSLSPTPRTILNSLPIPPVLMAEAGRLREEFSNYTLADAVTEIALCESLPSTDGISVMTIHQAKGLEWPAVIVPDCNVGVFPATTANMLEDRRLFYVAITRASEECVVLTRLGLPPSPFIEEAQI